MISVDSDPEGAIVLILDKKDKEIFKGTTPAAVKLNSGSGYMSKAFYTVKISAPGFEERIIPIVYKLNEWYVGNILLGGLIGLLIVDPISGAMWKLDSQPVIYANLKQVSSTAQAPELKIMNISDVPDYLKDKLVRVY